LKYYLTDIHNIGYKFESDLETLEEVTSYIKKQDKFVHLNVIDGKDTFEYSIAVDHIVRIYCNPRERKEQKNENEALRILKVSLNI